MIGRARLRKAALICAGVGLGALPLAAQAAKAPITIGITAPLGTIPGKAIANGATLAVDEINAKGGVNGRHFKLVIEDNHLSTADAIRSFQRMAKQDNAIAIIGAFTSENALALEPWSARLHEPFLVTGAASNKISEYVHADYKQRKYIFHAYVPSAYLALAVCDAAHDVLVGELHMKTAVVMSEDAAWTKPLDVGYDKCLPKAGLKVLKNIRFAPNTSDFTPIYQKIEGMHPDVIIAGWAHVGVQPTVQWAQQKVPIPLAGINAQAGSDAFWKATNGATQGIITTSTAAPGVAITQKTVPFSKSYEKKFGVSPAYSAYSTYDAIYVVAAALKRAKSTKPDALVAALEKTNLVGTQGRLVFQGPKAKFTHALKYGAKYTRGVEIQWQDGKQKCIWPLKLANAKPVFPSFVKVSAAQ
ncbi:MAG: ABC transporter substrate-binding protein [Stellaceae bacterium]